MALINLNDTTPAAPSGYQNAKWQADSSSPRNVSAYIPGAGGVLVKTADYTAVAEDCGKLIVFNSSGAHTLTLPGAAPFAQWNISVQNIGTGVVTISPNGLNVDGAASSLALSQAQGLALSTDATNYFTERGAVNVAPSIGGVAPKTGDYTAVAGDSGKLLVMNSGSAHTIILPSSPPSATWVIAIQNVGAGTLTVSRSGLTIDTAASDLSVTTGQGTLIWCDGSNYFTERGLGSPPTLTTKGDVLTYSTALARQPVGANGSCLQADSTQSTGIKWSLQPYDVTFAYPGAPPNATVLQLICFGRPVAMAGNFAGSTGHCGENPTSTAVYTVYKNASPIGTVTIATSGGFTFATTAGAAQSFIAGDTLSILTPTTDATLSSMTMTFAGTR
jgi:hypothetical protein